MTEVLELPKQRLRHFRESEILTSKDMNKMVDLINFLMDHFGLWVE